MYLANAYPSDAISAPMMAALVFAVAGGLAAWLILVFLADSRSHGGGRNVRQADTRTPVPAALNRAAEDEHSEAGHAPADSRQAAAA